MIKSIIFDVGDVLIFENAIKSRKRVSSKFNISLIKFKEYAKENLKLSHIGKLHYNDFFKNLLKQEGINTNLNEVVKEWLKERNRYSKINYKLLKIVRNLKKSYFIGLLTNSTILNDLAIARKKVYRLFPFRIVSNQVKIKKPDKEIYELLVSKLKKRGIKSEEILFIDDNEENLVPARSLGINTILFKDNKLLTQELNNLGVQYD